MNQDPQQTQGGMQDDGQSAVQGQQGNLHSQDDELASGVSSGVTSKAGSTASTPATRGAQSKAATLIPPVDVIEDVSGITLLADLPGVSKEGLNLRIEADSLTIEGTVTIDIPPDMQSRYAEIKQQNYARTFSLSKELDAEQAVAELHHGVLKLRIPKAQHAQPRKIQINVA